jgi:hypothetical protein
MDFLPTIREAEFDWLESHANEFTERLLVPPEPLRAALVDALQTAKKGRLHQMGCRRRNRAKPRGQPHSPAIRRLYGSDCQRITRGKISAADLTTQLKEVN